MIKSISSIIKDVLNKEKETQGKSDFDNIVQKIKNQVPKDVKIKTPQIDNSELQKKITETVGNILTDDEIESIVLLRNVTGITGKTGPQSDLEVQNSITDFDLIPSVTEAVETEILEIELTEATKQNVQVDGFIEETTIISTTEGEALLPNLSTVQTTDKNTAINQSYEASSIGIKDVHYILDL